MNPQLLLLLKKAQSRIKRYIGRKKVAWCIFDMRSIYNKMYHYLTSSRLRLARVVLNERPEWIFKPYSTRSSFLKISRGARVFAILSDNLYYKDNAVGIIPQFYIKVDHLSCRRNLQLQLQKLRLWLRWSTFIIPHPAVHIIIWFSYIHNFIPQFAAQKKGSVVVTD